MKSALLVIAQNTFRDEEYSEPKRVLESAGVEVTTASVMAGEAVGKLGLRVLAQTSVHDSLGGDWDAVAFIGGAGAAVFFDDPEAHELARATLERGAVLGAICIAPSTIAHAGLLEGIAATSFPSQEADLRAHGALWTGDPVTVEGRIVTANGPESAREFGHRIVELLGR
jgi:protease I